MSKVTLIIGPHASGKTTRLNQMIAERKDKKCLVTTTAELRRKLVPDVSAYEVIAVDNISKPYELIELIRLHKRYGAEIIATTWNLVPRAQAYDLVEKFEVVYLHWKGGVQE